MSTPTRLTVFAVGLFLAFGAAWGAGAAVDPVLDDPTPAQHGGEHDDE